MKKCVFLILSGDIYSVTAVKGVGGEQFSSYETCYFLCQPKRKIYILYYVVYLLVVLGINDRFILLFIYFFILFFVVLWLWKNVNDKLLDCNIVVDSLNSRTKRKKKKKKKGKAVGTLFFSSFFLFFFNHDIVFFIHANH